MPESHADLRLRLSAAPRGPQPPHVRTSGDDDHGGEPTPLAGEDALGVLAGRASAAGPTEQREGLARPQLAYDGPDPRLHERRMHDALDPQSGVGQKRAPLTFGQREQTAAFGRGESRSDGER